MHIIRPDSLPRLWWLFPWSIARQLHKNAVALKAMADRLEQAVTMQTHIISDQSEEIANLRQHLRNLEDSITRGAITPDAHPHE
jgi:dsDNA-specific endonuclease/ATPase MutS2